MFHLYKAIAAYIADRRNTIAILMLYCSTDLNLNRIHNLIEIHCFQISYIDQVLCTNHEKEIYFSSKSIIKNFFDF